MSDLERIELEAKRAAALAAAEVYERALVERAGDGAATLVAGEPRARKRTPVEIKPPKREVSDLAKRKAAHALKGAGFEVVK